MPAEGFLQQFHDLAEAEEEVRCRAALKVRQVLTASALDAAHADKHQEDLQYALRRLVRGVQSSRQCCRQGFSLALSELLSAFPGELAGVLMLINQHMELQAGLKPSEQKERLLGRLFAYAGIVEAGCLRNPNAEAKSAKAAGKKLPKGIAHEIGRGLHEIFSARAYLRAPASRMLAEVCRDLCLAGLAAKVPDALEAWSLEEMMKENGAFDVNAAALSLELRVLHEESGLQNALQTWPNCVRQDRFAKPAEVVRLVKGIGSELSSSLVGDAVPFAMGAFCHWWFRSAGKHDPSELQATVWPILDETLFPDHSNHAAQAQGLRALAELAGRLRLAGTEGSLTRANMEAILSSLFERMPRGLALLLRTLSWPKDHAHAAAVFAHQRLVEVLGAPPLGGHPKGKRKGQQGDQRAVAAAAPTPLKDGTRLAILAALQKHKAFGVMPGHYKRQWQHSLLAPLLPPGVRARCSSLVSDLLLAASTDNGGLNESGTGPQAIRIVAAQLEQLTEHSRAPDEVILAVLCFLFTAAYFAPADNACGSFSLRAFRSAVGLSASADGEDLSVPVLPPGESEAESRKAWRQKLWASLAALMRRPLPEMVEKITGKDNAKAEEGDAQDNAIVRTNAYHGCLSDGTLVIVRLHEWWDYLKKVAPQPARPRSSPKKKPKMLDGAAVLTCVVEVSDEDEALRKRCVSLCRAIAAVPEAEGELTQRQRRALCGLPLSMSLALLSLEAEEERASMREQLEEMLTELESMPKTLPGADVPKKRAKAEKQRAEILAAVPRMAAELFVDGLGLVKEAARAAWRELGEFTSDETITSLCASIRDADEEGSDEEDEDEEDDKAGGKESAIKKAKAEKFAKATEALKAQREKEEKEKEEKEDDEKSEEEDDGDDVMLDGDDMMQQLLDDGDGNQGLLASFAASGLDDPQSDNKKLTKRQQRLRARTDEVQRKFREIDLLETFLGRFVDKRPVGLKLLRELHESLWAISRRAAGSSGQGGQTSGEEKTGGKADKKRSKAEAGIKQLESDLAARLAKLLAKTLKQICRPGVVVELSSWHTADEWATFAKSLCTFGTSLKGVAAGPRPVEVGALLLYFFCAAHRALALGGKATEGDEGKGWKLANEVLTSILSDWGQKKDCERWCEAVLGAYVVRVPEVLLKLKWVDQIRASGEKRAFARRAQVSFVANRLLQGLPPALTERSMELATGFGELCTELLESTLEKTEKAEGDASASASQKVKLKREALRGTRAYLRVRGKQAKAAPNEALTKRICKVVAKVRDSLPSRRGELYQHCLHILRTLKVNVGGNGSQRSAASSDVETSAGKRKGRDGEQSEKEQKKESPAEKKQRKLGGREAKAAKGERQFFSEM
mmetsp:Transcript_74542/g.161235  ORF Transcript_74542/g.161235 Transcript_74542/m.161235 type:complete len:1363 (+) Transcript_74542:143-4231(+)